MLGVGGLTRGKHSLGQMLVVLTSLRDVEK